MKYGPDNKQAFAISQVVVSVICIIPNSLSISVGVRICERINYSLTLYQP